MKKSRKMRQHSPASGQNPSISFKNIKY